MEIFRRNKNPRGEFFALNNIAMIYHLIGEADNALTYGHKSLKVANEAGLDIIKVKILDTLGEIYIGANEYETALKLIKPGLHSDMVLNRFRKERQILASLIHPISLPKTRRQ